MNIIEKIRALLRKKSIADNDPFEGLINSEQNHLLCLEEGPKKKYDFYYVKNNKRFYVYELLKDKEFLSKYNKAISNYMTLHAIAPVDYFNLAEICGVKPDWDTFCKVVDNWMSSRQMDFLEEISSKDMPAKFPDDWPDIFDLYKEKWEHKLVQTECPKEGMAYADLFCIGGKYCLVTGDGKTKIIRKIIENEKIHGRLDTPDEVSLRLGEKTVEAYSVYELKYVPVKICIHCETEYTGEIKELDPYTYTIHSYPAARVFGVSELLIYKLASSEFTEKLLSVPFTQDVDEKYNMLKEWLSNNCN